MKWRRFENKPGINVGVNIFDSIMAAPPAVPSAAPPPSVSVSDMTHNPYPRISVVSEEELSEPILIDLTDIVVEKLFIPQRLVEQPEEVSPQQWVHAYGKIPPENSSQNFFQPSFTHVKPFVPQHRVIRTVGIVVAMSVVVGTVVAVSRRLRKFG